MVCYFRVGLRKCHLHNCGEVVFYLFGQHPPPPPPPGENGQILWSRDGGVIVEILSTATGKIKNMIRTISRAAG